MYDPNSLAFTINTPFKDKAGYKIPLINIWHIDPCKDGTDDSCGWYMRSRHGNDEMLNKIIKSFEFEIKHNYWFDNDGKQIFSTIGTLIQMFDKATWIYFNRNRKKQRKFLNKYLVDIILFAENPIDCIGDCITNKWGSEDMEIKSKHLANVIYQYILNKDRKWWKHPKWHIHHWKINFVFFRYFRKTKHKVNYNNDENLRATV